MKILDHGYVELIESWGSDELIVESARLSTGKNFMGWEPYPSGEVCQPNGEGLGRREKLPNFLAEIWWNTGKPDFIHSTNPYKDIKLEPGDAKLLRRLYEKRHTSPFEMAGAIFEIQAPIMVFREWHRHRTQSYSEMSARYTPLPDLNYRPTVERMMAKGGSNKQASKAEFGEELTEEAAVAWLDMLDSTYAVCEQTYQAGLKAGVPKELARLVVPVGRYSRMRASANLLNWIKFLTLRLPDDAQFEIREPAGCVAEQLSDLFPRTMSLFGEEMLKRLP